MATGPGLSLRVHRLDFGRGPPLFDGLSLDVAAGEVVALIGPSGVGKTTLLRMIAGVETGFDGKVTVNGVPAAAAPLPGLVFQDARLLPWLTAAGNLRAVHPQIGAEEVERLLTTVGLGGLAQVWPRQLSGGMQRRLGLARALSVNPGLLLLDEPFVSLDRAVVRELQALIAQIFAAHHPTAVIVSHDPDDAARLADRAILLAGRPARIVADLALGPLAGRSPQDCAAIVRRIETAAAAAGP